MTRVRLLKAMSLETLEKEINAAIQEIETGDCGVKSVSYQIDDHFQLYTGIIVYGKGPRTTQRWSGGTIA